MKVKTRELIDVALDLAVAKCEGWDQFDEDGVPILQLDSSHMRARWGLYSPSTDWGVGGPIIQKEGIELMCGLTEDMAARFKDASPHWSAFPFGRPDVLNKRYMGPTPLVAAMRCLVASELGEEVEVPEELLK